MAKLTGQRHERDQFVRPPLAALVEAALKPTARNRRLRREPLPVVPRRDEEIALEGHPHSFLVPEAAHPGDLVDVALRRLQQSLRRLQPQDLGEGLAEALAGAQVVVDVANSPSFEDKAVLEFFETSGRNLLAAEEKAGVKHHVALSVVGTERLLGSGYFRGKMAQEKLLTVGRIPYTLVRSTQFFEFMGGIAQAGTEGETVRLSTALMQPIASDDVADAVADVALGAPVNGIVEVAGPERVRLVDVVQRFMAAKQDVRKVIADARARYFGVELDDTSLTPGATPRVGPTRFEEWLRRPAP